MTADTNEQGTIRYMRCPSCGNMNPATSAACARCGKPLQEAPVVGPFPGAPGPTVEAPTTVAPRPPVTPVVAQVVCPKCKKSFPAGSKFCGYCGTPLPAPGPVAAVVQQAPQPRPAGRMPAPPQGQIIAPGVARPAASAPPRPMPPPPPVAKPVPVPPVAVPSKPPGTPQVSPTPYVAAQPRAAVATPVPPRPPAPAALPADGTVVFTGLHAATIEARVSEKRPDGSTGRTVAVTKEVLLGRENCDLNYPQDMLLAGRHASLAVREGKLILKDLESQNGSFIRQRQDAELSSGDIFVLGRKLFRFTTQSLDDTLPKEVNQETIVWGGPPKFQKAALTAKLEQIKLTGEAVAEFKLEKPETSLGRTTGDLIFKDDPYMSGAHARILAQSGRFILQDLRSRNGVYRRVRNEVELHDGDEFFMGEQLFRVEVKSVG